MMTRTVVQRWGARMGSVLLGLLFSAGIRAQDYHAIEGSPFAGSLGVANNPASILSTPYPWDITVFSTQLTNTTNSFTIHNFSLLSPGDTSQFSWNNGAFKHYGAFNFNMHLLNVRLDLGRKQAIAFGANMHSYGIAKTGAFNYNDTLQNINQFFNINQSTSYNASMVTSSWLELFGTYSRTLWDDVPGRLSAGITLKAMRGISGAYAQLKNGALQRTAQGDLTVYSLAAGSAHYGYSSNYDRWKNSQSTLQNLKDFLSDSRAGLAVDLGAEYLIKSQAVTNYSDGDTYYDYEWKIGVSLLDVGKNVFKYGTQSRAASNPKSSITDSLLNLKFDNVATLADFNDSMATIVNSFYALTGPFSIWNPARLVINVDRPLQGHFSINGNLSINLTGSNTGRRLYVKEINLLNLTPRWETRRLGAYLPVEVTTNGRLWVGGAAKFGPLLLGVHNWANVFSKDKMQNGGFYLAFVIRPGGGWAEKEAKMYTCPKN